MAASSDCVSPDLVYRSAVLEDFQAIFDINKSVYSGFDYLPSRYNWMVENPRNYAFVGLVDNKVVSFVNYHVADDTAVAMALRVSEQYQGRRLSVRIKDYARRQIRARRPEVRRELSTLRGTDWNDKYLRKTAGQFQMLAEWSHQFSVYTRETLQSAVQGFQDQTRLLNADDISDHVTAIRKLAEKTSGHLVHSTMWLPSKVTEENMIYAQNLPHQELRASFSNTHELTTLCFHAVDDVSFGMASNCYFYGDSTDTCIRHFEAHLLWMAGKTVNDHGRLGTMFHWPLTLNFERISSFLSDMFGGHDEETGPRQDTYLISVQL